MSKKYYYGNPAEVDISAPRVMQFVQIVSLLRKSRILHGVGDLSERARFLRKKQTPPPSLPPFPPYLQSLCPSQTPAPSSPFHIQKMKTMPKRVESW